MSVVMIHNGEDAEREQENLDVLVQQRVLGIMIAHAIRSSVDRLDARDIPLVYVDRVDERSERCWVKTDDIAGGRLAGEHLLALGVLLEFARRGIRVPDDVTIVGFDDLYWLEAATVPLTTVRQPREELGRHAVRLLLDEIDSGDAHVHRHEMLIPELVIRASSSRPRLTSSIA